jgi:hypothetical protein
MSAMRDYEGRRGACSPDVGLGIGAIDGRLAPGVPAFTPSCSPPGVGLAVRFPARETASGPAHAARQLADSMIVAYEQGQKSRNERMQTVAERFAQDGILLDEPFLNAGSIDEYQLEMNA